LISQDEASRSI